MARKASVDVAQVLQMLQEGQSTQVVADHFGVSRQAIDLHRKRFIQSGQLGDRRAPRLISAPEESAQPPIPPPSSLATSSVHEPSLYTAGKPPGRKEPSAKGEPEVPLDRLIELVIHAFDSLKKLPGVEAELEKYKQDYQKATERLAVLEQEAAKRKEQEARWQQALSSPTSPDTGKTNYGNLSGWRNV
jgi:hypothetical protein